MAVATFAIDGLFFQRTRHIDTRRIRIDIGLSYSAPVSQLWLSEGERGDEGRKADLLVFAFEPNPESVSSIRNGAKKRAPEHGEPVHLSFLRERRFCLLPCALGDVPNGSVQQRTFFVTEADAGCSSLFQPTSLAVKHQVTVPTLSLRDFLDLLPFEQLERGQIEYMKIDAQGADLDILKTVGKEFLSRRVKKVTAEAEEGPYIGTANGAKEMCEFMTSCGFQRNDDWSETFDHDPTFINRN